jgi:hypothetical protein
MAQGLKGILEDVGRFTMGGGLAGQAARSKTGRKAARATLKWGEEGGLAKNVYDVVRDVPGAAKTVWEGTSGPKGGPTDQMSKWLDQASKAKAQLPQGPTEAQDIHKALSTYMDAMSSLGPEYGKEMEHLKPYLNPGAQTFQGLLNTAALQASPTGNTAVSAAGQALANATAQEPTPGFGHAAQMMKQYEQSLPAQGPLQAALAYQKSLQTYGGMQPSTAGWSPAEKAAYQSITGTPLTPAGGGINTTPQSAAAQGNANAILSLSGLTGSGSAASATGG